MSDRLRLVVALLRAELAALEVWVDLGIYDAEVSRRVDAVRVALEALAP